MSSDLVSALEELRKVNELCRRQGHSELQSRLMRVRAMVLEGLHESLSLSDENAALQQLLREARAVISPSCGSRRR